MHLVNLYFTSFANVMWLCSKITEFYSCPSSWFGFHQVVLFLSQASKALKLSCNASWNHVLYHCRSSEFQGEQSENSFCSFVKAGIDLVNEASEKTAFLLDLLFEINQNKMNRQLKDSLEKWSIAENIFKSLPPPSTLVNRWVKVKYRSLLFCHVQILGIFRMLFVLWFQIQNKLCKIVPVEHSPTTLYSLLSSSVNVSKRALGVLLEQVWLSFS